MNCNRYIGPNWAVGDVIYLGDKSVCHGYLVLEVYSDHVSCICVHDSDNCLTDDGIPWHTKFFMTDKQFHEHPEIRILT